jgi:release factor glutamine methyltransferase
MKIASNKVQDLISFYETELKGIYEPNEINFLIQQSFKHYVNFSTADLITKRNENLNQSDVINIYDCCKALKQHQPLQYILGETEFYGLTFKVNRSVLIPRPETEELVELILKDIDRPVELLDIGTGSGCIPVSIRKNKINWNVSALDISEEALDVARLNAKLNTVDINFLKRNILSEEETRSLGSFDVIVSNPPYIAKQEADQMQERVKNFEPHLALFVEDTDALLFYRRIIIFAKTI